ncbi:MAG: hypothetical protein M5U16_10875 [Hyphomicrobium sp.]|nr:hypothetical protein [Hyphomicrobium sp.]
MLPEGHAIEQKTPTDGPAASDECHHNVINTSSTKLGKLIAKVPIAEISICGDGGPRPLTLADVEAFPKKDPVARPGAG